MNYDDFLLLPIEIFLQLFDLSIVIYLFLAGMSWRAGIFPLQPWDFIFLLPLLYSEWCCLLIRILRVLFLETLEIRMVMGATYKHEAPLCVDNPFYVYWAITQAFMSSNDAK